MSEVTTCDFCHLPISTNEDLVKVEVTTFAKNASGVPWAVSTAGERLDFHAKCWPKAKVKLSSG